MTSLGSSCLKYMNPLHAALSARGYDVAVLHSTGVGAWPSSGLPARAAFGCVMDFSAQEFVNMLHGSVVSAGLTG